MESEKWLVMCNGEIATSFRLRSTADIFVKKNNKDYFYELEVVENE